jgi:hypothetical protein
VGDVNSDGLLDLVVSSGRTTHSDGPLLSVYLNRGAADARWQGLADPAEYPVAKDPLSLVLEDFDADGHLDLAVGTAEHVAVHLGGGDGSFREPVTYMPGPGTRYLHVGDFDRDSDLDLAVTNADTASLAILAGHGDGTFELADESYALGKGGRDRQQPWGVTSGDFDQDGDLDLAVAHNYSYDDNVSVLLGEGDATFSPESLKYRIIGTPNFISSGDVDADGDLDLVVAHGGHLHLETYGNGPGGVSVLMGDGDGSFGQPIRVVNGPGTGVGGGATHSVLHDLEGNVHLDIVAATDERALLVRRVPETMFGVQLATYDAGSAPSAVSVGDLNHDGTADLVVANQSSADISVLLGRGDATFEQSGNPSARFAVGQRPTSQVAADLNGDGRLDLAVANISSDDISVLIGRTGGTFAPQIRYPVGDSPSSIVAADFDGDSLVDLAVANRDSHSVSVLLARGDGTFHRGKEYPAGRGPSGIAAVDLDRDKDLDLIVRNNNSVSVLVGRGDGTFLGEERFSITSNSSARFGPVLNQSAHDFNRDGYLDLAVIQHGSPDVSIMLGRQNGAFHDARTVRVGDGITSIAVGDVNSDGVPDLVLAHGIHEEIRCANGGSSLWSGRISVLLGDGDGRFRVAPTISFDEGLWSLAIADFNRDAKLDLVAGDHSGNTHVLMGNGDGTFKALSHTSNPQGGILQRIIAADFNADGNVDLFYNGTLFLGSRDGTFSIQPQFIRDAGIFLTAADVEGDLDLDLVFARDNYLLVYPLQCDGTFSRRPLPDTRRNIIEGASTAVEGDFDGDGDLDLAVASYDERVSVILGKGNGTFHTAVGYSIGNQIVSLVAGDFDRDGDLDISVLSVGSGDVSLLGGRGDGTFEGPRRYAVGAWWWDGSSVAVRDFNRDGVTDVLAANSDSTVSLLIGRADGSFQREMRQNVGSFSSTGITAEDLNADGVTDLVAAASRNVSILLGRGDGKFTPRNYQIEGTPDRAAAVTVKDVNRDALLDVMVSNGSGVAVLLGKGSGEFEPAQQYRVGNVTQGVVAGDFDADGDEDLAVLSEYSNDVSLLIGQGDGTFTDELRFGTGVPSDSVALADFNRDRRIDVAAAGGGSLAVLLGAGDGTFGEASRHAVGGPYGTGLSVNDFDRNRIADVAVLSQAFNTVSVVLGKGDGTFEKPVGYAAGDQPVWLTSSDVNADGTIDLVVANLNPSSLKVIPGKGDGSFGEPVQHRVPFDDVLVATAGDVDSDGDLDLVLGGNRYDADGLVRRELAVLLGNGDGTFATLATYASLSNAASLALADFDDDGIVDLAVAESARDWPGGSPIVHPGGGLAVMRGRGDGTFQADVHYYFARSDFYGLAAADLDSDGDQDLVLVNGSGANVLVNASWTPENPKPRVRRAGDGNGDGQFNQLDIVWVLQAGKYLTSQPATFAQGDWNGDGVFDRLDIVAALQTGDYLRGR